MVRAWKERADYGRRSLLGGLGLEFFEVYQQAGVVGVPVQGGTGVGAGSRLVHGEDGAERPEGLLGDLLDGQDEPPSDDCGDVDDTVALVGYGVP